MPNGNEGDKASRSIVWIRAAVVLLVLIAAVGSYLQSRPRRIRISVTHPERETISSSITTNGKVEPVRNFEAHAPAPVSIKQVFVKPGQQVKTGQLLVLLNDGDARERLARAQAQLSAAQDALANLKQGGTRQDLLARTSDLQKAVAERQTAERNLAALQALQQKGAASAEEVAAARDRLARARADEALQQATGSARYSTEDQQRAAADVANAQAAVASARQLMAAVEIRAPFAGTVYYLPVRDGGFVNMGDVLVMVADLHDMQVRAFVDEPEIGKLRIGEEVRVTWDAMPGRTWIGQVTTIPATVVNRGSRTVGELLCAVHNQDETLLPNVNVTVNIIVLNNANALTIPREALHEESGQAFVYVVKGNQIQRRDVKTGVTNLTRVEILGGLTGNETLGLASLSPLPMSNGITVKVVENPS
ncbi:MAG TPA: efflux RND transporter periplasmic adaptor subunit [Candidatus Acidoferrales bacterium]|nr:efflux RND transporter periplasmic adaptor subunit [Candidatus Acidoferrales bacterium]